MGNAITHVEIPCRDLRRAQAFYQAVFDWSFAPFDESYVLFEAEAPVSGGLWKSEELAGADGIRFYVRVEDIPATLQRGREAGGVILTEKTLISQEIGFFAFLGDTEGNRIGLFSRS